MILGLIGAGILLSAVLMVMVLAKRRRVAGDRWIAVWLAAHIAYFLAIGGAHMAAGSLAFSLALAGELAALVYAPSQYLTIWLAITIDVRRAKVRASLAFSFMALLIFAFMLIDIEVEQGTLVITGASVYLLVIPPVAIAMTLIYPAHGLLRLHDHRSVLKQRFSNLETTGLQWMRIWLISSLVMLVVQLIVFLISATMRVPLPIHIGVLIAAQIIQIAFVGYHGVRRSHVFQLNQWQVGQPSGNDAISVAHTDYLELESVFDRDKLYLDPDLTAPSVVAHLGWTPDRLTNALKLGAGTNFHDFVNRSRVAAVKELASDPANAQTSLSNLASTTGFRSSWALKAFFRKVEGVSLNRWRRLQAEAPE